MTVTKTSIVLGIVLAGFLQSQQLAAQDAAKSAAGSMKKEAQGAVQAAEGSAKKTAEGSMKKDDGAMAKVEMGQGGKVLLHETFDSHDIGDAPEVSALERVEQVSVIDGAGKAGSGKVAHFNDSDDELGALEYNVGDSELGSMYVEFDAMNNDPAKGDKNSAVIFGVGPWEEGQDLGLNSKAKRAFGLELYQQKNLKLRVGDGVIGQMEYDTAKPVNVKIWVNDNDEKTLTYKRPDNGESAALGADSVVAWINNSLIGELKATGNPMHREITEGSAVIGRVGFSSSSTKVADFLIDNLHVEDPSAKAEAAVGEGPAKK